MMGENAGAAFAGAPLFPVGTGLDVGQTVEDQ